MIEVAVNQRESTFQWGYTTENRSEEIEFLGRPTGCSGTCTHGINGESSAHTGGAESERASTWAVFMPFKANQLIEQNIIGAFPSHALQVDF